MNNTFFESLPLVGSQKQIQWAKRILSHMVAFVLANKEAIEQRIQNDIEARLSDRLSRIEKLPAEKREKRRNEALSTATQQHMEFSVEVLLGFIAQTRCAKLWIQNFRNWKPSIESAAALVYASEWRDYSAEACKARTGEDSIISRLEILKEKLRDGE